jgi:hypothetical protein
MHFPRNPDILAWLKGERSRERSNSTAEDILACFLPSLFCKLNMRRDQNTLYGAIAIPGGPFVEKDKEKGEKENP